MQRSTALRRGGYTLSEVLLVLGVIAGVAALAQPALRSSLGDSRLRSAARQIRTELAKTRLRAMESGTAQRFRYQVDKNCFEVAPADYDEQQVSDDSSMVTQASATAELGETPQARTAATRSEPIQAQLPDGVSFTTLEEQLALAVDEQGWSQPIVFYPNGRAADATIRLRGERGTVVDVSLRGLTGVATASKPHHDKAFQ